MRSQESTGKKNSTLKFTGLEFWSKSKSFGILVHLPLAKKNKILFSKREKSEVNFIKKGSSSCLKGCFDDVSARE